MQRFKVLREHMGDQFYDPRGVAGPAEREVEAVVVSHLVAAGVLEEIDDGEKPDAGHPKEPAAPLIDADGKKADDGKKANGDPPKEPAAPTVDSDGQKKGQKASE